MIDKLASAIKNNFDADILVVTDNPFSGKTFYLNQLSEKIKTITGIERSCESKIKVIDDIDIQLRNSTESVNKREIFNSEHLIISSVGLSITKFLPYNTGNCRVKFFHSINQLKREMDDFIDRFVYSENELIKIKESCNLTLNDNSSKSRRL